MSDTTSETDTPLQRKYTVFLIGAIYFCECVAFSSGTEFSGVFFYCCFIYLLLLQIQLSEGEIPFNDFIPPHFCVSQARALISNDVFRSLLVFNC
jgi:hypothetical protein